MITSQFLETGPKTFIYGISVYVNKTNYLNPWDKKKIMKIKKKKNFLDIIMPRRIIHAIIPCFEWNPLTMLSFDEILLSLKAAV
jgi:hypothetical protein